LKVKRILAPTDRSELSQDGVRVALEMARSEGRKLLFISLKLT
jgi:nucleotide-binding universal stress UspA family protein